MPIATAEGAKCADKSAGVIKDLYAIVVVVRNVHAVGAADRDAIVKKVKERKAKERLRRFLILLEPAAILLIGGVIGTIMIAIMLAITSLSNVTF